MYIITLNVNCCICCMDDILLLMSYYVVIAIWASRTMPWTIY